MFKLYSVQLDDGNRHFLKVIRMKNKMIVEVNSTLGDQPIAINQEVSSIVPILAEKLYLGNLINLPEPTTEAAVITTTTTTTQLPTTTTTTTTTSTTTSTTSLAPETTQPVVETATQPPEDLATAATAPIISRQRREDGREEATTFFKGVIMDIRLSNRKGVERIVKLFDLQLVGNDTQPNIEESLGDVTAHDIEQGTVSDDTCQVEPCQNGGKCKVTWNDYQCQCEDGYKGGDCEELEYCHWYKCPAHSTCRSLIDGHECITNATFDGSTNRLTYSASFEQPSALSNSISATFRSQAGGPLLSLTGANGQQVMLSVVDGNNGSLEVILLEGSEDGNLTFGANLTDGNWHTVTMEIREAIDIVVRIDDKEDEFEEYSTENSTVISLAQFVSNAEVVVGSGGLGQDIEFFRGCMQEVRIGGVLLPFFTEDELVNSTAGQKFELQQRSDDVTMGECVLCHEAECQNGGTCFNPSDKFP